MLAAPGDSAQVMDFGIVRQEGGGGLTATGAFIGTPDARSDIYSLGVSLFHRLSGFPPSPATRWTCCSSTATAIRRRRC
ncbi:MAG TPA: hypothetical protein QGI71_05755 [Dehalococcoidia bacterium]|nr:hypothetical protein [Dehalococcoidia bacterium]